MKTVKDCNRNVQLGPGEAPSRFDLAPMTLSSLIPTGEDLMHMAYLSTAGDPASFSVGIHGRRNPDRVDMEGLTKRIVHDSAVAGDHGWFHALAAQVRIEPWGFAPSLRTLIPKLEGHPEKGVRPIDDPCELKRLISLHVRRLLTRRLEARLTPGQYGGRPAWAVFPACQRAGATMQDHVATVVWRTIGEGYPHALAIDLKDAFGLVPKRAALVALQGIGLDQEAAEWVWQLVRIHAVDAATRRTLYTRTGRGIEQGNCMSASVLNLVLAPTIRALEKSLPVKTFTYLDDIIILAPTEAEAGEAFSRFRQSLRARSFTNVRRLRQPGDPRDSKFSRILNTKRIPVPVLKTYLVDGSGIALHPNKVGELKADGLVPTRVTIERLRELSNCQSVTEAATREASPGLLCNPRRRFNCAPKKDSVDPSAEAMESDQHEGELPDSPSKLKEDNREVVVGKPFLKEEPRRVNEQLEHTPTDHGALGAHTSYDSDIGREKRHSHLASYPTQGLNGNLGDETIHQETPSVLGVEHSRYSRNYQGNQAGGISPQGDSAVTAGGNTPGRGQGETADPPARLLSILDPEVRVAITKGLPLKMGDRYKGSLLDLRRTDEVIPSSWKPSRVAMVVNALLKVVRTRGRAVVLLDLLSSVGQGQSVLGGSEDRVYGREDTSILPDGSMMVTVLHRPARVPRTKRSGYRPRTGVLVVEIRRLNRATGEFEIRHLVGGAIRKQAVNVATPCEQGGALMALATFLSGHAGKSVGVRTSGLCGGAALLVGDTNPRQVVFHDAVAALRRNRKWVADGDFVVGSPS